MMNMETQNGELVRLFLQSIHIKNQQIQTALEEIQTFSKMVAPQIKHFLDYSASGKISINIGECGPGYYCPESLEATLLQYKPIGKQATSILDLPCSGLSTAITEDSRVQLGKSRYAETGFNQILQDIAQGKLPREQALAELLKATKAKSHWHGTSTIALDGKPAYRRTLGEDISYLTHEELQGIRQYYATWLHRKLTSEGTTGAEHFQHWFDFVATHEDLAPACHEFQEHCSNDEILVLVEKAHLEAQTDAHTKPMKRVKI